VIIGDVTGKGVQAAALTSLMRHGARFVAQTDARPCAIMQRLDSALKQRSEVAPCTALCLLLGEDGLTLCSAGHPMPLVVSADGEIAELGTPQLLLGVGTSYEWRDEQLALDPDATIVLHTDGVTDVRGAGGRFGEGRLREVLRRHAGAPPGELLANLDAVLADFQVGSQSDDTAMISLRHQPAPATAAAPCGGPARNSRTP